VAALLLGCLMFYPAPADAQKKKKEKKEFVWEWNHTMSGNKIIDDYLLSCDTLYTRIRTYKDSIASYVYVTDTLTVGGQKYDLVCMVDQVEKKYLSDGIARWQMFESIKAGTMITLEGLNIGLQTVSATTELPKLGLKAFSFGKYIKAGPTIIGMAKDEIGSIISNRKILMKSWNGAKENAIGIDAFSPELKAALMPIAGNDEEKYGKLFKKYILVCKHIEEAAVGEKTESEKDSLLNMSALQDYGLKDLPEGRAEPSADDMMKMLG
jgi:hypothetical protein